MPHEGWLNELLGPPSEGHPSGFRLAQLSKFIYPVELYKPHGHSPKIFSAKKPTVKVV